MLELFPLTTAQLREQSGALKTHLLYRIAQHFTRHPAPVNRPQQQTDEEPRELAQLLSYHVQTTTTSTAFIIELRAEQFDFEDELGERQSEAYEVLGTEELLDVLEVLESAVTAA